MADETFDQRALLIAHARTYHSFTLLVKWVCITLGTTVVFLIASFCTPAGVGWGLLLALIVAVVGIYAMRHGLAHSSEEDQVRADLGGG